MDNVTFETKISPVTGEEVEYAYIENADGSFTSMTKAHYEAQLELSTEIIPSE